jgi:hypothetical protein
MFDKPYESRDACDEAKKCSLLSSMHRTCPVLHRTSAPDTIAYVFTEQVSLEHI